MICPVVTAESCIINTLEEMASKYQISFVFLMLTSHGKKIRLGIVSFILLDSCWIFFKFYISA